MTSGLPDYLDEAFVVDALEDPARAQTPRAALRYAVGEKWIFAPGEGFEYSKTNYILLGLILEQASGQSFAQVIQEQVISPAGMSGAFVFGSVALPVRFPDAVEDGQNLRACYGVEGMGDGGVIGSAADLARFYRALFGGGLLAPAQMADLLSDPLGEGYGMGLELEGDLVGHSGGDLGFSADIWLDRDSGMLSVFLAAQPDADTGWTYEVLGY
jgi:D-alanyl-D-alanine carboxypeptidase